MAKSNLQTLPDSTALITRVKNNFQESILTTRNCMEDLAPIMAEDEEAVQEVEGEGGNCEEVHGRDGFAMITKKGPPTLGGFRISGCAPHPAGDGSFGNLIAEYAEFAVNARSTPTRILSAHAPNEVANLTWS